MMLAFIAPQGNKLGNNQAKKPVRLYRISRRICLAGERICQFSY
jgi:hypothetical protein